MNTENAIATGHDDVVFENRNKAYGAYSIRQSYESNLSRGSAVSLLMMGLVLAAIQAAIMINPGIKEAFKKPIVEGGIILKPIIIADPQPPKQIQHHARVQTNFPPRVVTTIVEDPLPIDTQTNVSSGNTNPGGGETTLNGGDIGVSTAPTAVAPPQQQTVDIAEVMPEFEGGSKALYKFLHKTLRYPKAAQRIGQEGVVYVRFVIDVTGSVTGVEVIRGVAGVLDNEASRVIGLMPKWKPGSQHGEPVNVRMVLPINFKISGNE